MQQPDATDLPERLVLYPSRWKAIGLLVLCAAFTAGGALMIRDGTAGGWHFSHGGVDGAVSLKVPEPEPFGSSS